MLYMDFKVPEDKLLPIPSGMYNAYYDKKWFDDPVVPSIIVKVDGAEHTIGDIFYHPVTGRFTALNASGGAKTLILAYLGIVPQYVLPLSWLGENCFPILGELDIKKDIVFDGDCVPQLLNWGCRFVSKKTGSIIDDYYSYRKEWEKYVLKDSES